MNLAFTDAHLRAAIADLDARGIRYPVIGYRLSAGWGGGDRLRLGSEELDVAACASVLEVREKIALRSDDARRLVVLTAVPEGELGEDVLVRLARRRLLSIDRWDLVKAAFQARDVDPRLAECDWIAEALLEDVPPSGYPPVPAGILDRDTAWGVVLARDLGLGVARPDAVELLAWSLDSGAPARYARLSAERRAAYTRWLADGVGEVGRVVMEAFDAGFGGDAVAVGLACELAFGEDSAGDSALVRAQGRLERFVGGSRLAADVARRWGKAARDLVADRLRESGAVRIRPVLERFDEVLREIQADEYAHLSDLSPSGLVARLERFADELERIVAGRTELVDALEAQAETVRRHRLLGAHPGTEEKLELAVKLARWWVEIGRPILVGAVEPAAALPDVMVAYAGSSALVDLARGALREGDAVGPFTRACTALAARASEAREHENRRFGEMAAAWLEAGSRSPAIVPIEDVLERLCRPLAEKRPLLVVVLDGLSWPVLYELLDDLTARGWVPLGHEDVGTVPGATALTAKTVLAAFPTTTEVCRSALLTGKLGTGDAGGEKRGFASHRALVDVSKSKFPPVLFHKPDLLGPGAGGLSDRVRGEIASADRRVVGVVLNAVDDYLSKSDQLRVSWQVAVVEHLDALLDEAKKAGRIVVLTSDHGHILEAGTTLRRAEPGSRWRHAVEPAQADEVRLTGPRVATNDGILVAPWSERVRYSAGKQTGYHGGVSPQEAVVPFAVVVPATEVPTIEAWQESGIAYPTWWRGDESAVAPATGAAPGSAGRPKKTRVSEAQLALGLKGAPAPAKSVAPPRPDPEWLGKLLESPLFRRQREAASRTPLEDERIRAFLIALDRNGGRLTRLALQQRLGIPPARIGGLIATMQRILNVDAYPVLTDDVGAGTLDLNVSLLVAQFEIGP